jgi:hypothetical protein
MQFLAFIQLYRYYLTQNPQFLVLFSNQSTDFQALGLYAQYSANEDNVFH